MIVSVSRRTDIPAFYSEWFFNRLKKGYVLVVNPFNSKQISKIELTPNSTDCFVFWTKDAAPMLPHLDELAAFNYYFQFTITSYRKDVEPGTRDKKDIINTFKELSNKIGKSHVIWRYDPILLNDYYTKEYHYKWFEKFCDELKDSTEKCIISFWDFYKKAERNTRNLKIKDISKKDMCEIANKLSLIASNYGIILQTCSEEIDLSYYNIKKGKCIDDDLISRITGRAIHTKKDSTQRESCGCIKSVDIGEYNSCIHHCLYCYANFNETLVERNHLKHDKLSPLLIGNISGNEKITVREMKSIFL